MSTVLIGLTGRMGSGKSTVADHLCREHGFTEYAFAEPIKAGLAAILGITPEELERQKRSHLPVFPGYEVGIRGMMQTLGTEWGRSGIHPNFWLDLAAQRLDHLAAFSQEGPAGLVISDVRFENEADFVRQRGGVIVHIKNQTRDQGAWSHISEATLAIHDNDYVVQNNSSLIDLHDEIDALLARIARRRAAA